ncbi:CoA transferase [Nocardioides sp. 31GB23]|uniref:CaiB/BaiF CoA transferase family protein n=1 Tax=Nocardioides sp. 31GB23 TaxID=3156065 RepID=UPI0032AEE05E
MLNAPLAGLRVVDFGLLLPSPFVSRLLADLGADVISVHPPSGDPGYQLLPGIAPHLHRGKRAVRLDLKTPGGLDTALGILATADIVLEGFRPGVADRLGIGFQAVSARRPGVVYCSISGYGQSGPKRTMPAHDANIEASGGVFAGSLAVGDTPPTPYLPVADLSASMFAALSIVSAILGGVRSSGEPESVLLDVSMEESVMQFALPRWGRCLTDAVEPVAEDLVAYSAGAGVFATSDGRHVAIAAIETPFWSALCHGIGRADLASAPYDTHAGRSAERAELRTLVAEAIAGRTAAALIDELEPLGVPITLVRTVAEVAADEHLRARGAILPAPEGLRVAHPVVWSGTRPASSDTDPDHVRDLANILAELSTAPIGAT